jgi:hypothetical protein
MPSYQVLDHDFKVQYHYQNKKKSKKAKETLLKSCQQKGWGCFELEALVGQLWSSPAAFVWSWLIWRPAS